MYIDKPNQELLNVEQTKRNLEALLAQPCPDEIPPCPGCQNHIKSKCSGNCEEAPLALSTQPKEFPIENSVAPLVFGLMSTRVLQTCWSCEGHMDINDNLIKLPTVSFYTSACVYAQLLHKHVTQLKLDKKLSYSWHVVLSDYAQTWGMTYSIVPDLNFVNQNIRLGGLQNDLKVIAQDLQAKMKFLAREMILELDNWINTNKL